MSKRVMLYDRVVIVKRGEAFFVVVGHICVAQHSGGGKAGGIIFEIQNGHTGVAVIETSPHDMRRNMQQTGDPCPGKAGVAE